MGRRTILIIDKMRGIIKNDTPSARFHWHFKYTYPSIFKVNRASKSTPRLLKGSANEALGHCFYPARSPDR